MPLEPPLVEPGPSLEWVFTVLCAVSHEGCAALPDQVRGSVEGGIEYLLQKREADPYKDPLPRWLYEAASGGKQAPTFRLN